MLNLGMFAQFLNNPNQFNITMEMLQNPSKTIQNLMNSGKISQEQYDWAVNQAQMIQKNPQFKQFFSNFKQ